MEMSESKTPQSARPKPVTPQRVRAMLAYRGMLRMNGFRVREHAISRDLLVVEYASPIKTVAHARISAALTAAGIACEIRYGAVYVKVDQTPAEKLSL
jgi:hypothetical protein